LFVVGKALVSLCGGLALAGIQKGLFIYGRRRQKKRKKLVDVILRHGIKPNMSKIRELRRKHIKLNIGLLGM